MSFSRILSKALLATMIAGYIIMPNVEACACGMPVFYKEDKQVVSTATAPEQILIWDGMTESFFVDFKLEGNAADFGIVIPLPAEAEINEGTKEQFQELRRLTARKESEREGFDGGSVSAAPRSGVEIVKEDAVGAYLITTLKASETDALLQWLTDNGYQYADKDKANFAYYVNQGKFYFLAIKVNTDKKTDVTGDYELHPLVFTFPTNVPYLPLRYVAGHDELPDTLTLYTITPKPVFVAGTPIEYSDLIVDPSTLPALWAYPLKGRWLTRSTIAIDTSRIDRDPALVEWQYPETIELFQGNVAPVIAEDEISVLPMRINANPTSPFLDVHRHFSEPHVTKLFNLGIVSGRSATEFAPDSNLTRAEALKLVAKTFYSVDVPTAAVSGSGFADVALKDWFAPYVEFGVRKEIIAPRQFFEPYRPVSRAEFVKMITAAALPYTQLSMPELNDNFEKTFAATTFLDLPAHEWFTPYVRAGFMIGGLDSRGAFYPYNSITRGEAAKILSVVMQNVQ